MTDTHVHEAISYFVIPGQLKAIHPFKVGHINETYISTWSEGGVAKRYLHQMVNKYVFKNVPQVMENIERVIAHIKRKRGADSRETLTIIPSKDGRSFIQDAHGEFWRTYEFLENTVSFEVCTEPRQAYEAAKVLGRFLAYLSDCQTSEYHETIVNFQNVPNRFLQFDEALKRDSENRCAQAKKEIQFALARREYAGLAEALRAEGKIPVRVTHSDPKFNNVLFNTAPSQGPGASYGAGLAVVDLDTVMPGTMLYDFGDLARSVVVSTPEDEVDLNKVIVNEELFSELARGYLEGTQGLLTHAEVEHMHLAPRLIALSLGVRFLTDFLAGDVYFKIHRLNHNLDRARTQFRIVSEMEKAEERMREAVARVAFRT